MAKNWALAIGINQYNNLQHLNYAKLDAEAMRDWFGKEARFDQVFLFTEDSPAIPTNPPIPTQPTYGNLRRFLRANFEKPLLEPGDNLWFFFAGHGCREADRDYLMLIDSDPGDVEHTAIPVDYVIQRLRRSGADNVVLFLDACRDDGSRRGVGIGEEHQGVVTFYSCSPSQKSYEIEQLQHGSFTQALLEGLRIAGEGNCATVERLDRYLQARVPAINQIHRKTQQYPYVAAEPATKLHLILLPDYATLNDINQLKLDAYQAEVIGDWELARQLWLRVNVAARGSDMQVIEAFIRIAQRQGQSSALLKNPEPSLGGERSEVSQPLLTANQTGLQIFQFDVVTVNASGQEVRRDRSKAQYFSEDLGNDITVEMVYIAGGKFMMGTEDEEIERLMQKFKWDGFKREKPQHQVTLKSFFMGKNPVTQAQWRRVATLPKVKHDLKTDPSSFKGDNRPVEQVSWNDAVEFCDRISKYTNKQYRLPSEAEWEYACRAGTTTPFHFGQTMTTELANYDGTDTYGSELLGKKLGETTGVETFPPNGFGLYDMHGNVEEWCQDTYHESYKKAPTDGSAWLNDNQSRIRRGGSWGSSPRYCRSAFRSFHYWAERDSLYSNIGFRVVCAVGRILQ
ncbi:SUMF1/EgtB/PvdO family nonheme iron enzyme [Tolypothrix sp. PCC 7910]|uniref:SUMF1/EgtB/PvdO family nonheme iron enzyme n=1 Tax=Tolypothrix sp. PCC 7910 TaxID=2099387 RepID=UPI0014279CAA|nr:SUMF1/EgtB/PvdO family nonheme iron enzyme [Tolypothrix sp. PCC 7910]QIR40446.1 SUMF1/EgtB/PvdO family nonheme iron enzyme [Tolypothrix sp. PCC 7910]